MFWRYTSTIKHKIIPCLSQNKQLCRRFTTKKFSSFTTITPYGLQKKVTRSHSVVHKNTSSVTVQSHALQYRVKRAKLLTVSFV